MEGVAKLAREHKPKMIMAGGSAYARHWDFAGFREIATRSGPISSSTSPTSPGWWPAGRIPRRSPMPTSSPRRPTRRCAARAAG